jgi:hypothetical protein
MKTIREALLYFFCGLLGCYLSLTLASGRWHYELRPDGSVKRAWHVRGPGYQEYIRLHTNPPVIQSRFTMGAFYRVGPWIDPEWVNDAQPANRPVGRD